MAITVCPNPTSWCGPVAAEVWGWFLSLSWMPLWPSSLLHSSERRLLYLWRLWSPFCRSMDLYLFYMLRIWELSSDFAVAGLPQLVLLWRPILVALVGFDFGRTLNYGAWEMPMLLRAAAWHGPMELCSKDLPPDLCRLTADLESTQHKHQKRCVSADWVDVTWGLRAKYGTGSPHPICSSSWDLSLRAALGRSQHFSKVNPSVLLSTWHTYPLVMTNIAMV